jgi:hypothetical protein
MLLLTLDCGRQVYLDAFDYRSTYAGLLEGGPNDKINSGRITDAQAAHEPTWGKRRVHLIPPDMDLTDPAHPVLPQVLLRAWLVCYQPVNPAFHGSELVVVWFAGECHAEPITDVVYRAVRGLLWEQLADDFYW